MTYTYDNRNNLLRQTDPEGNMTSLPIMGTALS